MKHRLLIIPLLLLCAHVSFSQTPKGAIDAFTASTGALPTIDPATGSLSFLRFPAQRALQINGGDAQQKSMNFISQYKTLFAIRDGEDEFRLREQKTDNYGLQNVTLQQTYKGVPVYDGLMKFHYNSAQGLTALNGNFISEIKVNVVPTLAQHEAESIAAGLVTTQQLGKSSVPVKVNKSTLCIFQKGLAQGFNGSKFLVYEVEVRNDADVREFLFIDAHDGQLVEQFKGMHNITRKLYETSVTVANLKWQEGDAFPGTLDQWQQSEVESSGFIYNLMKNAFGYVSFNGGDAAMITINNNPNINCPNANWNGATANYCTGTATDDVVAHEWGHAYTEYTSGLIYQWQPGALNEAYSDIWGETVDQLDGYMDSGESNALRTSCGSSARWQVGEKATAFGGALRDMWDPTCKGDPGKVSDPQYWCANSDEGGVHTNSGVINHTYALLVDGGTYNGQTITGIGLTKAAHIFWRAQSIYMTATTDFAAQADILEAAANDLIGINLQGLSTGTSAPGASGQIITADDVAQLVKVITAVELRSATNCGFQATLAPAPALCEGANAGLAIFYEGFESGLGGFTTSFSTSSAGWVSRQWQQVVAPGGRAGHAAFGIDYQGGNCNTATNQSGIIRIESPVITIPAGTAGDLVMAFDHYIALEDSWDGGNIKFSINNGAWTEVPPAAFIANGYNNVLTSSAAGSSNPLAGQFAFTGTDQGSVTGSWGQSQINLNAAGIGLVPGNTIKFRFEVGTDICGGVEGWYVDDIRVFTCAVTPAVHFAAASAIVNEGEATTVDPSGCLKYVDKMISIGIDKAPTQPVTVTFNTPTGTAKQGATGDYIISPSSVTLQAGSLNTNVTVRILNDAYVEGPETINLSYALNANGGNGYAASTLQNFELTINDDDLPPGNYTEELLSSNFNNGQQGWKAINGGNSYHTWAIAQYSNAGFEDGSPFFFVNSAINNAYILDEILESPVINTSARKNLVLSFRQIWERQVGDFAETGTVEVWDGTAWQTLVTQNEATGNLGSLLGYTSTLTTINIPDAYANVNMKIRFRYISRSEIWWAIDDVKLTAAHSNQILSTVNSGNAARQYLGPNETAVFYDPATGNLMAKIKNLSAHDYGCTTVEIDRAGANGTPWLGSYQVTNKTFKVTPTNNNPAGQYEITLYYNASELTTFTPANIQSMGKTSGTIATAGAANTTLAEVVDSPALTSDYAFTATFNTGFSGFGLSNAPPGAALPVTLVDFEGKNTSEGNVLQWTTSSESNNDYFAIEESTNGKNFTESGRVKGVGNASVTTRYDFTDVDFNKGITYYRLKQVDFDGKYAYSRMIAIDAPSAGNIRFYPNPVQSALDIELPNLQRNWVNARVINASGQEVIVKERAVVQNGRLNIQLGKLPAGIYQVLIANDKVSYRLSVFKP
ncbi:Zn-dependent metalloprotease [Dyadobacter sp. BE34]|uniref:Zn-dependent metalloprotease n=1 Tax=Dyadobacter fermentans TaxID=94254 RepID=A0ABU1QXM8_9BACT|nr:MULTISPECIES: M4 family metallopeptidase [Dyadobacter]MDR6805918.1 Zn-dependent metalloprotease [Dyadobacter fermentans]MDR7042321.1 Zn-dependent metalloprotease [Dyadobacter sp. BE242]MDR7201319.1 Zn-dependent metalloprotease [Dyadobacter sp. BE34]MDR7215932.1 Zn-dependent metalloprotease [Dyadobacter sp. BE31]MDR7263468.1 Zn-dependent metalloprotease [Dyadobacter sp. BE32]